jgi:hypothetical protein
MENIESSIVLIANRWKDNPNVVAAAKQLANFSKTYGRIQALDDIESRKNPDSLAERGGVVLGSCLGYCRGKN